ncbi:MAB_1171c family putative transporter [Kitasatospora sp. NPDC052896]|uniref:MAB_1171c family putative transporter n=1 Tax=Kitasatospora sp. NPDC052896 TaxID=3364061 RepID=UPI0037C7E77F
MADLAGYLAAAVFLGFALHRFRAVRTHQADRVQRYATAAALGLGVWLVMLTPATLAAVSRLGVGRELAMLLGDGVRIGALGMLLLLASALRESDGRLLPRPALIEAVVVQLACGLLFAAAHPVLVGSCTVAPGARRWPLAGYDVLFVGYSLRCVLAFGAVLTERIRRAAPGLLRAGLVLMLLADLVAVAWTLWGLDDVLDMLRAGRQDSGEDLPSTALGALCAALAVGGATVSVWGGAAWAGPLTAPVRWLRARRRYRALEPLWSALRRAVPEIELAEPDGGRGPELRRAEFALYRRIIEIRDAHLALRPCFHPAVPGWVAELTGGGGASGAAAHGAVSYDALEEAALLAAALEARGSGRRRLGGPAGRGAPRPVPGTVDAEADWLLTVTEAFTRSPEVAEIRRRVRAEFATDSAPAG